MMSSEIIQNIVNDNYGDFQHVVHFIFSQKFISLFRGCCCGIWVCSCESLWQHTYMNPPQLQLSLSNNLSSSRWQIHTHKYNTEQPNPRLFRVKSTWPTTLSLLPFHMIFKFIAPQQQTTTTSSWMWLCGPMRKSSKYSWCTSLLTCLYKGTKFGSPQLCQSCWVPTTYPPSPRTNKTKQWVRHHTLWPCHFTF